jgi:hypothetical protein
MRTAMLRRLAFSIAVGMLASWPMQPQQKSKEPVRSVPIDPRTPEQIQADEANIRRICQRAREAYEAVDREYRAALARLNRHPDDSILRIEAADLEAERRRALAKYCECLRTSYAKANLPMPDALKILCEEASAIAPPAPPQPPPADGGGPPEREDRGPGDRFSIPDLPADLARLCRRERSEYDRVWKEWRRATENEDEEEEEETWDELRLAAQNYCDCMRRQNGGQLPPQLEPFCQMGGRFFLDPEELRPAGPPPKPAAEPPPPPPPPAAPGTGRRGGGTGGGALPTPTPNAPPGAPVPTRTPTPNFVQLWTPQPGTTANVAMTVFSHGGNHRTGDPLFHDPDGCSEVSRATLLTFVTFGADAFSVAVGGLQPLPCARIGSADSFRCQGTFPEFGGLANVGGSIDPLNVANGGVQGTFTVAVPGGGVVYQFTGRIQP